MAQNTLGFSIQEVLVDGFHHPGHFSGGFLLRIHVGSKVSCYMTVIARHAQSFSPILHLFADVRIGHVRQDLDVLKRGLRHGS